MYTLDKSHIDQMLNAATKLFASLTAESGTSFAYEPIVLHYKDTLYSRVGLPPEIFCDNYEREIIFLNTPFKLLWNVEQLKLLSRDMQTRQIPTNAAFMCVDESNILRDKLYQNNTDPALIAEIPFVENGFAAVDGNHRIASAYYQHKPFIKCKFLPYYVHMNALSPTTKILFKIMFNIWNYANYCNGNIGEKDLEQLLLDI